MKEILFHQAVEVVVGAELGGSRVVHQTVDPAPLCHGFLNHATAVGILGYIGPAKKRLGPQGLTGGLNLPGPLLALGIIHHDAVTPAGEEFDGRCADSSGRSGDNGNRMLGTGHDTSSF
jgi:hypothetical protein